MTDSIIWYFQKYVKNDTVEIEAEIEVEKAAGDRWISVSNYQFNI